MQSIIKKFRNFGIWSIGIFAIFAVVRAQFPDSPPTPPVGVSAPAPATMKPTMKVEITAPVGKYSEWVKIPPNSVFRIEYSGEVIRKDMRGKEFDVGPKMIPRMLADDDDGSFAFQFKSREVTPVVVTLHHHPK